MSARRDEETAVLIVGAGPTGLVLAAELPLAGVRCRILERRGERARRTKAFEVNTRTMELLDMRGLADDVLRSALPVPGMRLNIVKKRRWQMRHQPRHHASCVPAGLDTPERRSGPRQQRVQASPPAAHGYSPRRPSSTPAPGIPASHTLNSHRSTRARVGVWPPG